MKNSVKLCEIRDTLLFHHLSDEEIKKVLNCLKAEEVSYAKDTQVLIDRKGTPLVGIVLSGSIFMVCTDSDGNRSILNNAGKSEIFGLSLIMDDFGDNLCVVAAEDCRVLLIDANTILWGCACSCDTHKQLLYNLIGILSKSNMSLLRKFRHISQHTLRRKIVSFLNEQADILGIDEFTIPFNRQEMADYLGADRSALSAELSRMKKEGLIDYQKNRFQILKRVYA
ncbi:MAG: Crp/Fnr family transcriptional regulator [Clostridia bacterium]